MENYNRIDKNEFGTYYYLNNDLHRLDGPAIEYLDGTKDWWIEGKRIYCNSQKEFERYIKLKLFW
jgi:hypothetical protein